MILQSIYCHPQFTEEHTEPQKYEMTGPRSLALKLKFELKILWL